MKMSNTEGFDLLTKWCDEARTVGFTICSGLAPAMAIAQGLGRLSRVEESAATITAGFVSKLIEARMGESAVSGVVKSLEITIPLHGAEYEYSDARELDNPIEPPDGELPEHPNDAQLVITLNHRLLGFALVTFSDRLECEIAEQTKPGDG
jgi:hypothetical protein